VALLLPDVVPTITIMVIPIPPSLAFLIIK
jgi:hypothetical protein